MVEQIVSAGVGFLIGIPAVFAFVRRFTVPAKEVAELVNAVTQALEDGKLSADEIKNIIKESKDVKLAVTKIFMKAT